MATITIQTGEYTGGFYLNGPGRLGSADEPYCFSETGATEFNLEAGRYTFSVAKAGFSYFYFDVDVQGIITNVSNPVSAYANGNVLTLHTKKILLDTGRYGRECGVCQLGVRPYLVFGWIRTTGIYVFVPGLVYEFDNGETAGSSTFPFYVCSDGSVRTGTSAAQGEGRCTWENQRVDGVLRLNYASLYVEPPVGDLVCYSVGGDHEKKYSGPSYAPILPGLRTNIRIDGNNYNFLNPNYAEMETIMIGNRQFKWSVPWEHL